MRGATGLLSSVSGGAGTGPSGFHGQQQMQMPDEEQPNVSPQEQAQYDAFVQNGMQIIYTEDDKINPEVLKRLSTGKEYVNTLAQTTVWLVMMIESSAKKNGQEIDDDVMLHASKELFEQLVEVAEKAGIHDFNDKEMQGAWYQALDMYREANSDEGDRFGPEGNEEASSAFAELNEADREGRADELVPGFYEQTEKGLQGIAAHDDSQPAGTQDDMEGQR